MNIADNIRNLRKEKDLSQEDLGILAELPQTTISGLENKNSNPGIKTLVKIAEALDVTVEDLIKN